MLPSKRSVSTKTDVNIPGLVCPLPVILSKFAFVLSAGELHRMTIERSYNGSEGWGKKQTH